MKQFISYGKQWIDDDDIAAVVEVLRSDFMTQGPKIGEFEKALCDYTGAKYAVAVSSGTAALHLAVSALNIAKEKKGITSPITFAASANCFLYNGMKPGFVDIDRRTFCMDPIELETKIKKGKENETGVVIPVHFGGQPCEMEKIARILGRADFTTNSKGPYIIEDASHALGSKHENGKRVGSCCWSDMAIFSFHPVKTIATAEGGAITTNNKELYDRLMVLRTHGITKDETKWKIKDTDFTGPWYYEMQELGFNYRLTDMQSALGLSQMKKIDKFTARRREIVDIYNTAFKKVEWLSTPYEREGLFSTFHLYVLEFDFKKINKTRTEVMNTLKEKGIGTQVHYIPVHLLPYYREHFGFKPGDFPKAERYYGKCMSIPLYPKMTDEDVQRVIGEISALGE